MSTSFGANDIVTVTNEAKRMTFPQHPQDVFVRAPNGTTIVFVVSNPPVMIPPLKPRLVVSQFTPSSTANSGSIPFNQGKEKVTGHEDGDWVCGRAGMLYRDLIPCRLGGRFIASHIRIPSGGSVPDYVHYHKVRFQMIYCYKGWVRVVYEDQGPDFILYPGDCVFAAAYDTSPVRAYQPYMQSPDPILTCIHLSRSPRFLYLSLPRTLVELHLNSRMIVLFFGFLSLYTVRLFQPYRMTVFSEFWKAPMSWK